MQFLRKCGRAKQHTDPREPPAALALHFALYSLFVNLFLAVPRLRVKPSPGLVPNDTKIFTPGGGVMQQENTGNGILKWIINLLPQEWFSGLLHQEVKGKKNVNRVRMSKCHLNWAYELLFLFLFVYVTVTVTVAFVIVVVIVGGGGRGVDDDDGK